MPVSFGLASRITNHPAYNFGLALPFVCAFYVLGSKFPLIIPYLGISLGDELSMVLRIGWVTFCYVGFFMFFAVALVISRYLNESKWFYMLPIVFCVASFFALLTGDGIPVFYSFFGVVSLFLIVFSKYENGRLSFVFVEIFTAFLCVALFVLGVLWLFDFHAMPHTVAFFFGFDVLDKSTLKLGGSMLITLAYSLFFALEYFKEELK